MLTIGEFSRICFVTKKTLRHYDEIGLLHPEYIAENGYRYYTVSQLRTMLLSSKLKSYGLSLPEIASYLANPDEDQLAAKLTEKHRQLELELQNSRSILHQMEQDIEKLQRRIDIMEHNIAVKTIGLDPVTVYGIRKTINVKDFGELFGELFEVIGQKRLQPMGPPLAFYYDEEFDGGHGDIEIAVPVAGDIEGSREQPGGLHCFATIVGPYEGDVFSATYAGLVNWIEENGYRICNAPFDKYVKGGPDTSPKEYITEVYFPIEKQA